MRPRIRHSVRRIRWPRGHIARVAAGHRPAAEVAMAHGGSWRYIWCLGDRIWPSYGRGTAGRRRLRRRGRTRGVCCWLGGSVAAAAAGPPVACCCPLMLVARWWPGRPEAIPCGRGRGVRRGGVAVSSSARRGSCGGCDSCDDEAATACDVRRRRRGRAGEVRLVGGCIRELATVGSGTAAALHPRDPPRLRLRIPGLSACSGWDSPDKILIGITAGGEAVGVRGRRSPHWGRHLEPIPARTSTCRDISR